MSTSIEFRNILAELLAPYLGKYDPIDQPAIYLVPPQLPTNYSIKSKLGVEAIIRRMPTEIKGERIGTQKIINNREWEVVLTQYDRSNTLELAVNAIVRSFRAPEIRIRPQVETADGIVLEQAIIKIPSQSLENRILL